MTVQPTPREQALALLPQRVDRACFEHAAVHVARQLAFEPVAHVVIQPGDATRYPFKVVRPTVEATVPVFSSGETEPDLTKSRDYWIVLEGHGRAAGQAMAWAGYYTTPDYVAEKMGLRDHYTSQVVAGFLSLLATLIGREGAA